MVRSQILLLISCFISGVAVSSIVTKIDPQIVELGQNVTATFEIQGRLDDEFDLPIVDGLEIIHRESAQSMSMGFGQGMTIQKSYTFHLRALRTGFFKIPEFEVSIDGEIHKIDNLSFEVKESVQKPKTGKEIVFLERELSNQKVFVGQSFVDTLKFYSLPGVLKGGNIYEYQAKDARTVKLEKESTYQEAVQGTTYEVIPVQYVIIPGRSGELELSPHHAEVSLQSSGRSRRRGWDPFDDFFARAERKEIWSPSKKVEVMPLPTPQPTGFSGLVGNFSAYADVNKSQLKVGETATITLKIEGDGELGPLGEYELDEMRGLKFYADNPVEKENFHSLGLKSTRILKFAVVPSNPGSFKFRPEKIIVFSPKRRRYEEVQFPIIELKVQGDGSQPPITSSKFQNENQIDEQDILPLKDIVRNQKIYSPHDVTLKEIRIWCALALSPWFLKWMQLCFVFCNRKRSHGSERRSAFKKLKALKKNSNLTCDAAMQTWQEYLGAVCGFSGRSLTSNDLSKHFESLDFEKIQGVFHKLEEWSYGANQVSREEIDNVLELALSVAQELEKRK